MSDDIIQGATGAQYRTFRVPKFIGYWSAIGGAVKHPAEERPSLWRRFTHGVLLGWTWHDGLDGL
jgi:hypothetical protein